MLHSYFLWRNFILLPGETEKEEGTPLSDRQNKYLSSPPLAEQAYTENCLCCQPWVLTHSHLPYKAGSMPCLCPPAGSSTAERGSASPQALTQSPLAQLSWKVKVFLKHTRPECVWVGGRAHQSHSLCCS